MSSLRDLAAKIYKLADQLEDHRTTVNIEPSSPRQWLHTLPKDLGRSRLQLLDTLQEMKREILTVESTVMECTYAVSKCFRHRCC